ncbi:MAG TPA: ribonuclease HI [Elusimicrobia bacterium]|nr:ribonuclease HI [Elusimicrobiota bacterium]HBT63024.1 ribonuclease HI [Elusimicrobiota bacterium]
MAEGGFLIYTDGACSGNPGPGGWAAVVQGPDGSVRELGGAQAQTTNNRMELSAAIEALRFLAGRAGRADIFTDSTYLIAGITRWLRLWKRKGWRRADGAETLNRDLWQELDDLASRREGGVTWNYVRGHNGHPGNSRCDEIAVAFSRGKPPSLYRGPSSGYSVDMTPPSPEPLPAAAKGPQAAGRPAGPKRAGWYLSLLDGKLERHQLWAECQARVHGRPALFKKVVSPEEEADILRKWGLK